MEHKHLLTYEEEILSFTAYKNEVWYHISPPNEINIKIKIHSGYDGTFEREIVEVFPINSAAGDEKTILSEFLFNFLCNAPFYGNPYLVESDWFTYDEFAQLKAKSNEIIRKRKEEIRQQGKDNTLIQYCESKGLNPEPEGEPNSWLANCPSGGKHHIMISTSSDQWGCGYCRKKGGLEELKEWVEYK